MRDGYSICLNEWALDKTIKDDLGLLLIISSLTAEKGYCYAKNSYFAEMFDINEVSVSRKINKLIKKGYLTAEYEMRGNEIKNRKLRLTKMLTDRYQKSEPTINKNVNGYPINNIIYNNTIHKRESIGQSPTPVPQNKRFKKPSLEEVKEYCLERKNKIDAENFINFYDSKGWKVGNTPMKDWKACVRTWEKKNFANFDFKKPRANIKTRENIDTSGLIDDLDNICV